jgi:2-succinyl-6-hydroxy-2,4-cyclohexadiene-1-carboxylate synthase
MTVAPTRVIALHGFLGSSSDWDRLRPHIGDAELDAIDIWDAVSGAGGDARSALIDAIGAAVSARVEQAELARTIVLGYSLGARVTLALAASRALRSSVRGICLVSCHPGLADDDEAGRATRRAADGVWADRILQWPEVRLWREWDAQPVFAGSTNPSMRAGLPALRSVLARSMRGLSLADQPDYRPWLAAPELPVLWVTGARDAKFAALAEGLRRSGARVTLRTCAGAGHRVPWDQPSEFARLVADWIEQLSSVAGVGRLGA